MASATPTLSLADCFAHALTVEREAVQRYNEFADHFEDQGNEAAADLMRKLARFESEHASALSRKASDMPLPPLNATTHSWLDDGPPESVSHELIFHFMTPHDALEIALRAEQRAKAFFEQVEADSVDPDVRGLAREMAGEERALIRVIEDALPGAPRRFTYDEDDFRDFLYPMRPANAVPA